MVSYFLFPYSFLPLHFHLLNLRILHHEVLYQTLYLLNSTNRCTLVAAEAIIPTFIRPLFSKPFEEGVGFGAVLFGHTFILFFPPRFM